MWCSLPILICFQYDTPTCQAPLPPGSITTTYQYNANGQRNRKQTGASTTTSLWESGKIIEDFNTSGGTTGKNMYVQGLFIEGVVKPQTNEYGYEEYTDFNLNSFDTNHDIAATWRINTDTSSSDYSYEAYGVKTVGGSLPSPFGYNGYYQDSETGFYYLNARYYDPTTQQFTQEDTYWGDGTDLYAYCHFNPVMYSDPSGHVSMSEIAELWAKDYAMEAANAQWAIDNYGISSRIGKSAESYIQNYTDSCYE